MCLLGSIGYTRGNRHDIKHIGLHWIHTFRVNLSGGQETRDRGQWELLEATGTASNTLDSTGYTPLGLIFRGGQGRGEGDSGNYWRQEPRHETHSLVTHLWGLSC